MDDELQTLKDNRKKINKRISDIEKAEEERQKTKDLLEHYVKVVCDDCSGHGELIGTGAGDNMDVDSETCDECGGRGWIYVRLWDGRLESGEDYDMDFDERR